MAAIAADPRTAMPATPPTDDTPLDDPFLGKVIGERYRIEALLGEGGVGRVYRARHATLGRPVALKVLLTEHEGSGVLRERFRREAEALAGLSHPNIVAVTDFGVHDESPFLVMELLEGRSLAEVLREGAMEPARALALTRQVLLALGYAHAHEVVHRDLKPHNIIVRRLGDGTDHVTVLDFGLARFVGEAKRSGAALTRAGMLIGTPAYMAPEQASGDVDAIDARTDVYAAGLVLYETLTRRRPFIVSDPGQLLRAHLLDDPPRLEEADPSLRVSKELQALVSRALAKSATVRFANATEMLAALDALDVDAARREGAPLDQADMASMVSAPTIAAAPTPKRALQAAREASAPSRAKAGRSPWPLVIAGAVGLALLGLGGAVAFWLASPTPETPAPQVIARPAPPPPPEPIEPVEQRLQNPFDAPLPDPLARLHAAVQRGRSLSRSQVRVVRDWARDNDHDVRAHLLLGHSYTNERALSWALPEYEAAMERDPSALAYPEMLKDLLEMARSRALARRAADRIVQWYGADALGMVNAQLEGRLRRDEQRRLEALRERLTAP